MNDFFKSQNKAMVSATPIVPSDPRFQEQTFRMDKITPAYDHTKQLIFYPTNNVHATLKLALQQITEQQKVCIFFNSTNGIEELINVLKIKINPMYIAVQTARINSKAISLRMYMTA